MKNKFLLLTLMCMIHICTSGNRACAQGPCPVISGTGLTAASICYPGTVGLVTTGGYSTAAETWSSSNTLAATVLSAGPSTGAATVYSATGGTTIITYSDGGGPPVTCPFTVTVGPNPGIITGSTPVCRGSTISLSDPTGDAGGSWQSSNTAVATVDNLTGVVTGEGAGTAIISYGKRVTCGTDLATTTVEVDVPVTPTVTGASSVCMGSTATLTGSPTGGTWTSSENSIAGADISTGVVTGVTAGTVNITYTFTNACGAYTGTHAMTVNPQPSVAFITGMPDVCISYSTLLSDATTGGTWSSSNTSVASVDGSGNVYGLAMGGVIITYTVTNIYGCEADKGYNFVVEIPLTPDAITGTASVCVGASTALADATTGGLWSSTATTTATVDAAGNVTGVAAGTATISYYLTNACGTYAATQVVTVNPLPYAGSLTGSPYEICYTDGVLLYTSGDHGGTWSSSATAVATVEGVGADVGLVYGASGGTATITYTVTSGFGCGSATATKVITVDPTPNAGTITGTATICEGASTALADAAAGGTWSSDNTYIATVSTGGVVYGVETGTAIITYTITNACGSAHATEVVTVNPLADAGYISGTFELCTGSSTLLTDAATGGTWSSSNTTVATVDPSGNLYAVAGGTTTISYEVTNGCGPEYATQAVTMDVSPDAGAITGTATVCPGATTALTDAAAGGTWSSVFTTIATVNASGTVTGVASGVTVISYIVSNSCGSVFATQDVTVNAIADPGTISGAGSFCLSSTTTLSETVTGGTWSSSNTSIATINPSSGSVTGSATGTATITYMVTNGCGSETATYGVTVFTVNITVAGGEGTPPVPASGGPAIICPPDGYGGPFITLFTGSADYGTWSSSNTAVATVTESDIHTCWLTGIESGTTTLTYTYLGCATTLTVTVTAVPASGSISGSDPYPNHTMSAGTVNVTGACGTCSYSWYLAPLPSVISSCTCGLTTTITIGTDDPGDTYATFYVTDSYGCENATSYGITVSE